MKIRVVLFLTWDGRRLERVCNLARYPDRGDELTAGAERLGQVDWISHSVSDADEYVGSIVCWVEYREGKDRANLMAALETAGFVVVSNVHDVGAT